jgi:anti-anti-sigma factor
MSSRTEREVGVSGPPFELEITPDRERVIVAPAGEIDLATAPRLQQGIEELLNGGFTQIVVDLHRVTFMDSQGVHALVIVHNQAKELGATLTLVLGNTTARTTLELSGVLRHLNVAR